MGEGLFRKFDQRPKRNFAGKWHAVAVHLGRELLGWETRYVRHSACRLRRFIPWGLRPNQRAHTVRPLHRGLFARFSKCLSRPFLCIHGYASDGVNAANAVPTSWLWWANGWTNSPAPGIPANVQGFTGYGKKSWMTETSGENPAWLSPATGFPSGGAWSLALRIQQALVFGQQSAWAYWQLT